jgi:diguanylate cyclase (GGDEF)-like protein/PAS domain S-box-containing protein
MSQRDLPCTVVQFAAAVVSVCVAGSLAFSQARWLRITDAVVLAGLALVLVASALRHRPAAAKSAESERVERGFDDAAIGMMILSQQLEIMRVNRALCVLLARDPPDLLGHSILEFTHSEDLQQSVALRTTMIDDQHDGLLVKRYIRPDGSVIEALVTPALVTPEDGPPYFFSQLRDVTEQRRAEREKSAIADLGRRALECTDAMALIDEAMHVVRDILGIEQCLTTRRLASGAVRIVATTGESLATTFAPDQPTQTMYTLQANAPVVSNDLKAETRFAVPPLVFEMGLLRGLSVSVPERSGARHVVIAYAAPGGRMFSADDVSFVEAIAHVISGALDREATEHELRRKALEDPLTGLGNRALLATQLEAELRHARRLGERVLVLALDLDRFSGINDALGHGAGDALLRQVAARLTGCVREEDFVARPGGDEFTVVATRTATDHAINEVAQRIVEAINEPFEFDGNEIILTASAGVAISERGDEPADELLRNAEAAMYRAKQLGGGHYEAFDAALRERLSERVALERDLRHALGRDELELHYQPLIDLSDERVVGFEALLRWRHPERGMVGPDEFIHIAEETGLIIPIGSWVLAAVCDQLARWPETIHVSANVSPAQIRPELVDEVRELLAEHQIAPARLVLEITESLVLDPHTKPIVTSLRALGVQLALDDFGTGYSSLGSLQRFPLDVLKLDRTLIASLGESGGAAVVRAAVELGHALNVAVIAEGIEGANQLHTLRDLGCPIGQGFLFHRPLPLLDAHRLVSSSQEPPETVQAPAA